MSALARLPLWTAMALVLWVLLLGIPVFIGHRCGFGFGCLTSAALFAAVVLAGCVVFSPVRR